MSADNWTTCARCLQNAKEAHAEQEESVAALYGQVPIAEFDEKRAAIEPIDPQKFRTFREDYEFWAEDGRVEWSYRGGCTVCKLRCEVSGHKRFWDSIAREAIA